MHVPGLFAAKNDVTDNLNAIQLNLTRCVSEGMLDYQDAYYNELSDLIDETDLCKSWDELIEVITKGKTLEIDVAAWLSGHGQNSISLPWPKPPSN